MSPSLSVVIPLVHARGDVVENVRTWTEHQSLERERFQVVVATDGAAPEVERAIAGLLAPHDVLERSPGAGYMALYNLGAERADADWIVLTEAHVLADPGCLASVTAELERAPDLDAAQLVAGDHVRPSPFAELLAEWFDSVFERWEEPGEWKRLSFFGTAIRRTAYLDAGTVNDVYGLFSPALLSATLDAGGAQVGRFAGARVVHIADEEITEHHEHTFDFARGECALRAERDAVFCERYFGWAPLWGNRTRYRPDVARPVVRALAAAAAHALARRRHDAPWILRELMRWLPAAIGGPRPRAAFEGTALAAEERAAMGVPGRERRRRSMVRAHARVVRLAQLEWIRAHLEGPGPARWDGALRPVEELDGALTGVHALEHDGERWWRWTEPVVHLRVAAPAAGGVLAIDTGGRRGTPLNHVSGVYVGARRIRNRRLVEDGARLLVPLDEAEWARAAREGISILTRPREPRREGSDDPRRMGLPVYGLEVVPAAGALAATVREAARVGAER
jgi:glycosyl transferase family 2